MPFKPFTKKGAKDDADGEDKRPPWLKAKDDKKGANKRAAARRVKKKGR